MKAEKIILGILILIVLAPITLATSMEIEYPLYYNNTSNDFNNLLF